MARLHIYRNPDTGHKVEIFSRSNGTWGATYVIREADVPDTVTSDHRYVKRVRRNLLTNGFELLDREPRPKYRFAGLELLRRPFAKSAA